MAKRIIIAPKAMAKYLVLHSLLDSRNAFAAAFAALESLILDAAIVISGIRMSKRNFKEQKIYLTSKCLYFKGFLTA
jgi:hypothetical protein